MKLILEFGGFNYQIFNSSIVHYLSGSDQSPPKWYLTGSTYPSFFLSFLHYLFSSPRTQPHHQNALCDFLSFPAKSHRSSSLSPFPVSSKMEKQSHPFPTKIPARTSTKQPQIATTFRTSEQQQSRPPFPLSSTQQTKTDHTTTKTLLILFLLFPVSSSGHFLNKAAPVNWSKEEENASSLCPCPFLIFCSFVCFTGVSAPTSNAGEHQLRQLQ